MVNESIGVALVGCGRIAGHHARSIRQTPGLHLVAACDLKIEAAEKYGEEFSVQAYSDYRRMLRENPDIQVVAIMTPSGMHYEHALEIVRDFGKSVVLEKPTVLRPSQLGALYQAAQSKGVQVFPVFQNRHNAAVQRVKRGLVADELGEVRVLAVRVRWCRPQRYYDLAPWRGTFALDGGALTNQGIHHIDLLRYLGGEVSRVVSKLSTLRADIEVEDTAVAILEFESGALGILEITTAAEPSDFEASVSLVCADGLAQIGGIAVNELQMFTPAPEDCTLATEDFSSSVYGNGHQKIYEEVAACMHGNTAFPVTQSDVTSTLKLLNALYVSDELDGWADVASDRESLRLGRVDDDLSALYRTP
jgi:predicted dehydrogenase